MTEKAPDHPDVPALMILLTRLIQTISETLIKLAEHQAEATKFPDELVLKLSDEMTWASRVIRDTAKSEGGS